MRYYDEVTKPESFKQLCLLADKEEWCWNICCGTCGHQNFVKSFALLINVREDMEIRLVNKVKSYHRMKDSLSEYGNSLKLQEKVKDVSIKFLSENCQFPSFLGYLGLALYYSATAEKENRVLTTTWIPQLIPLMVPDKGTSHLRKNWETNRWERYTLEKTSIESLQDIVANNEVLTWINLKCVYNNLYPTRGRYYLVEKIKKNELQ